MQKSRKHLASSKRGDDLAVTDSGHGRLAPVRLAWQADARDVSKHTAELELCSFGRALLWHKWCRFGVPVQR
jgi:hypothetical protein